jgi:hypothetical protein
VVSVLKYRNNSYKGIVIKKDYLEPEVILT